MSRRSITVGSAFAALLCCAAFCSSAAAEPWCAVLGGFPYADLPKASALADKARAAGAAESAVYDTRDFTTMAWGELVVVGARRTSRKEAEAEVKKLRKLKLQAFAKPCEAEDEPKAIAAAADLKPLPTLSTTPATFDPNDLPSGCFGWSAKHSAVACQSSATSLQEGGPIEITFHRRGIGPLEVDRLGFQDFDHVTAVPPALTAQIQKELKEGGYVALSDDLKRELAPSGLLHWASPRVTVQWLRKSKRVAVETGSWSDHTDTLRARCGGAKAAWVELWSGFTHSDEPTGSLWAIPQTPWIIVQVSGSWGIEGDNGGETTGFLFNAETCEVAK